MHCSLMSHQYSFDRSGFTQQVYYKLLNVYFILQWLGKLSNLISYQ